VTARDVNGKSVRPAGATIVVMARTKTRRRWVRRVLGLGLLAGASYAIWRAVEANRSETATRWEPQPFPFPPQPAAAHDDAGALRDAWVAPSGSACPASHPVKAKLASRIFHVPGGLSYERTTPDRCYLDGDAAAAEGFRAAKR
jgi:hypothetical protein